MFWISPHAEQRGTPWISVPRVNESSRLCCRHAWRHGAEEAAKQHVKGLLWLLKANYKFAKFIITFYAEGMSDENGSCDRGWRAEQVDLISMVLSNLGSEP